MEDKNEIKIFNSKTKEYIKEYNKQRYLQNREKLLVAVSKRYFCDSCQKESVSCKKNRHLNSKLHKDNVQNEIEKNADK